MHSISSTTDVTTRPGDGWVKPVRQRTLPELLARITELRTELADLEKEAEDLQTEARLEAIAKIRNIMRAYDLTFADVAPRK